MPRGGARNRSGPQPDPTSARTERRGLTFTPLPPEGRKGKTPPFPIPALKDPQTRRVTPLAAREKAIWRALWKTPQATVWENEPWRWRIIAEMCRVEASVELAHEPSAALIGQLHRYRDQIGLTPAGMRENGWQIAQPAAPEKKQPRTTRTSAAERFQVIEGG